MQQAGCTCKWSGARLTIAVQGEIDHHSAKGLREEIDRAMYLYRPPVLALDLGGVTFMDSSGLGLILGRYTKLKSIGGALVISHPTPEILKLLVLAGADKLVKIEPAAKKGLKR